MTRAIKKIGLIQTSPLPGDFSNNLRAIVQGYRECLNHGAELVIAPAAALCGLEPGALSIRRSFISQTRAALEAYGLPEVQYFLDTFMDSFSLTLDELK